MGVTRCFSRVPEDCRRFEGGIRRVLKGVSVLQGNQGASERFTGG